MPGNVMETVIPPYISFFRRLELAENFGPESTEKTVLRFIILSL